MTIMSIVTMDRLTTGLPSLLSSSLEALHGMP